MSYRAKDWVTKGDAEKDEFNRFVSYFIAFNILYSLHAGRKDPSVDLTREDRAHAIQIAEEITDKQALVENLEPTLSSYLSLIPISQDEHWTSGDQGIAKSLKLAARRNDANETVTYLLKWLYKVRCNIIHGGKDADPAKWGKILELSSELLRAILNSLM